MLYDPKWQETIKAPEVKIEVWQDLLLDAANILETEGWCQLRMYEGSKSCAIGSLFKANRVRFGTDSLTDPTVTADLFTAMDKLRSLLPKRDVEDWNDTTGRTKAEVTAKLREAANVV